MDLKIFIGKVNNPVPIGGLPVEYREADIFPDEGITIKRDVIDEHGLGNASKQFTKEFLLPATYINNELFGHYENKANTTTRNPNQSIPARIEIAGVYIIGGRIEMLSVTWKNRQPYTYKVVFYGDASGVGVTLGTTLMTDIDWSRFAFPLTGEQVARSWDKTLYPNTFVPIISWHRWFYWASFYSSFPQNNINIEEFGILIDELRPAMNLKEMIRCIGDQFGFNFIFDQKIDGFLEEAFVVPSRAADEYQLINPAIYLINVQTPDGSPQSLHDSGVGRNLVTLTQENTDSFNQWTQDIFFNPQFTGEYTFHLQYNGKKKAYKTLWIVENTGGTDVAGPVFTGNDKVGTMVITATLTKGTQYRFELSTSTADDVALVLDQQTAPVSTYGSSWNPTLAMPTDVTVKEFIASFMAAFNLVLVQTDLDQFEFIDMVTLYSGDNVVDLDKYVDEQLLTFDKMPVYNLLNFKHAESTDDQNQTFRNIAGRYYAELIYQTAADFSDGPLELETLFTAIPPAYMSRLVEFQPDATTDMRHFYNLNWKGWDEDSEPIETPFLLMYRNDVHTTSYPYWLQSSILADGTPQFTQINTYGNYSMVQDTAAVEVSNSLTFAEENTFGALVPQNTIIRMFWFEWLVQVYKATTYTLEVKFPAEFGVFLRVTETSIVFLMGFYHFIMDWEYNSNTGMLKMKLMRFDRIQYDPIFVVHNEVQVTFGDDDVVWTKTPGGVTKQTMVGPIQLKL